MKEIGPCRVFFTATKSHSAKDLAPSPAGSSGYQGPPITNILLALPPCLKVSLKLRKEPAGALKRPFPLPSLNPGPTAQPPTSGPVQAQGTRRCPGGGWRFPRGGRVARRGVRLGAVALRLAVLFVQTQRRQRQLLPGDEQREWVRGKRTTPRSCSLRHPPRGGLEDPSPFLPPAVPGVPEALSKRVVVYLQLRDLRGPRGGGAPGQDAGLPAWPGAPGGQPLPAQRRAYECPLDIRPPRMGRSEPKSRPRRKRQNLSSFKIFIRGRIAQFAHTSPKLCAQNRNLSKHAQRRSLNLNKPRT